MRAKSAHRPSRQSLFGLNAVNFFLAELAGVVGPFLAVFLKQEHWNYSQIGIAAAAAGLGTLVAQTPVGYFCDLLKDRKMLLAVTSLLLGGAFAALPLLTSHVTIVIAILFLTGVISAFFVPLLASLALSLVGPGRFASVTGQNQSWNHAGNISAAVLALVIVKFLGVKAIFFVMASVSIFATASLVLIKKDEIHPSEVCTVGDSNRANVWHVLREFLKTPQIRILLFSVMLFHLANAPVLPLVGLYIKQLGGEDAKVAWTVLIAQAVMVPVALLAGRHCENRGRKFVLGIAFLILPIRILLYTCTTNQTLLLAIQSLDGIGAGIYGVAIALICSDLTHGKGGFNMLMGLAQTALALGGFLGPLTQGFVTERFGFKFTFVLLAIVAALGALIFLLGMKETKKLSSASH